MGHKTEKGSLNCSGAEDGSDESIQQLDQNEYSMKYGELFMFNQALAPNISFVVKVTNNHTQLESFWL